VARVRPPPSPSASGSDTDSISEPDRYEVERIIEKRGAKFLVKWKGYGESENTWEPRGNLDDCQDLLNDFEAKQAAPKKVVAATRKASRASRRQRAHIFTHKISPEPTDTFGKILNF
jgi:hypothetical protein